MTAHTAHRARILKPFSGTVAGTNRSTGIKEVAARAGVSVGTVSNVLNRPDVVAEPTRRRVPAGDRPARLRAQRTGPPATRRAEQDDRLRHARRGQPVLHRRRQGHRGGRQSERRRAVHLQQRQRRVTRGRLPRTAAPAAGARGARHAGRPGHLPARRARSPWHPRRARRPRRRVRLLQRRRRRRRGRHPRRDPPLRAGPRAHRLHRRSDVDRAGHRPAGGRAASRRRLHGARPRDRRAQRRRGPPGRRAAGRTPPRPAPDGGVLRQRPPRPRAAAADDGDRRRRARASWRSSATTTSSSPAPPRCRSARCASPASCSGAPPPSCCSPRARPTRPTCTSRCCSTRSWWCAPRRSGRRAGAKASQSYRRSGVNVSIDAVRATIRRPCAVPSRTPAATAWTMALPMTVASTGPASTGRSHALAHSRPSRPIAAPPPTRWMRAAAAPLTCSIVATVRPPRRGERVEDGAGDLRRRGRHGLTRLGARRGDAHRDVAGRGEARVVGIDDAAPAGHLLRRGDELRRRPRLAVRRPPPAALLEQPQPGHVLEQADGAVDAELVGDVGRQRGGGGDRSGQLAPDEGPRAAGDVDVARSRLERRAGDGTGRVVAGDGDHPERRSPWSRAPCPARAAAAAGRGAARRPR